MLHTLNTTGVAVYSLPNINFNQDLFKRQQMEFIDTNGSLRMSARGLMGNPSSQHCEEIRRIRQMIHEQLRSHFMKEYPGKYIQFIIDRVSVRYPGTHVAGDDWHRDMSGPPEKGTRIFGGWFNLNSTHTSVREAFLQTQYFSHVPCSWADVLPEADANGNTGYDRLPPEMVAQYKRLREIAIVPPGHGVIFDENIVHEVKIDKRPKGSPSSWRLYIKVKLSTNNNVLFGKDVILTRLSNQAMMPLNLTEESPMYDLRHPQFWMAKLLEFSKNIKPVFLQKTESRIVTRFMMSLQTASAHDPTIQMHPEYTVDERKHLLPSLLLDTATTTTQTTAGPVVNLDANLVANLVASFVAGLDTAASLNANLDTDVNLNANLDTVASLNASLETDVNLNASLETNDFEVDENDLVDDGVDEIEFDVLDKPYKRAKTCSACLNKIPNQMAHMEPGGCFDPELSGIINDLY